MSKQLRSGFDWSQYKRQHVQAVDMVAATIYAHRVKMIPVKSLHLVPNMYAQFKQWTERNLGRELTGEERLEFDGVNILLGENGQKTPILIELYVSPIMA